MRNVSLVTLVMKWEPTWSLVLAEAVVTDHSPVHCDSQRGTFLTSAILHPLDIKVKINMKSILAASHSIGFTIAA